VTLLLAAALSAGLLQTLVAALSFLILRNGTHPQGSSAGSRTPRCAVIMPSLGTPPGFATTIRAHARNCAATGSRFLVCVESDQDPGVPMILEAAREFASVELVVAGPTALSSQQNHNMLAGVAAAEDAEILAFADNDFTPPPRWLETLVRPLESEAVTVTTGYRWIVGPGTIAGHFHALASMTMVAWFVPLSRIFGAGLWGGSFALRRRDFESLGVAERWRTSISDDLTLTAALMAHGKRATFVPELLIATDDCIAEPRRAFAWFERQILNTKAHARPLWGLVLLGLGLEGFGLLLPFLALGALPFEALSPLAPHAALAGAVAWTGAVIPTIGYTALGPIRGQATLWALAPLLRLAQAAAALRTLFSNEIRWAGVTYRFNRRGEVTDVRREAKSSGQP
jgi:hypothetical protein